MNFSSILTEAILGGNQIIQENLTQEIECNIKFHKCSGASSGTRRQKLWSLEQESFVLPTTSEALKEILPFGKSIFRFIFIRSVLLDCLHVSPLSSLLIVNIAT